jgi:hypothetical protein
MEYLKIIKTSMHEMIGVPETALGQVQQISNTSGVALAIQYQPLMNRYNQKIVQYSEGLKRINELVLLTLAVKEPEMFMYNPDFNGPIKSDQLQVCDPNDPLTYETSVHFPQPLPLDKLILLNEIQTKMSMNLESREGALRTLGEEFPDEKLDEIRTELIEDAKADGALNLIKSQINSAIASLTGILPEGQGELAPGQEAGAGVGPGPAGQPGIVTPFEAQTIEQMQTDLVTKAYGTKLPQRRGSKGDSKYGEE